MAKTSNSGKNRGLFLNSVLIITVIVALISMIPVTGLNGLFLVSVFVGFISLLICYLIWSWVKFGIYMLIGVTIIVVLASIFNALTTSRNTSNGIGLEYLITITPIAWNLLFLWAISRKWKYFK